MSGTLQSQVAALWGATRKAEITRAMSDRFSDDGFIDANEAVATTVFRDVTMIALAAILVRPMALVSGHAGRAAAA